MAHKKPRGKSWGARRLAQGGDGKSTEAGRFLSRFPGADSRPERAYTAGTGAKRVRRRRPARKEGTSRSTRPRRAGHGVRFRQRNSAKHKAEPSEVPRYYGARGKRQRPGKESRGRLPIIGVGGARARVSLKRGDGKSTEAGRFPRPGAGSRPGRAPPRKRSRRNGSQTRPGERDDEDTRQK